MFHALRYLPTSTQIVNILNKALPCHLFIDFQHKFGIHYISLPPLREGESENQHIKEQIKH